MSRKLYPFRVREFTGVLFDLSVGEIMSPMPALPASATTDRIEREADRNHHGLRSRPDFGRRWAVLGSNQ
jgi:hypothetical protein